MFNRAAVLMMSCGALLSGCGEDARSENQEAIWKLAEEGKVKPRVDAEYPLDRWREAFDSLADRKVIGKTIVRPDL